MLRTLNTVALLLLLAGPALADLTGSGAELVLPSDAQGAVGAVVHFRFEVSNESVDNNWIQNLTFTFPECCRVVEMGWDDSAAHNDWVFRFEGTGTNVARFLDDAYPLWGEVAPGGVQGWFDVYARITSACSAAAETVEWHLIGDGWGAEPHEVSGSLPIQFILLPVAEANWSTVKAGYRP